MKIGMIKSLPLEAFSSTESNRRDLGTGPVRGDGESFMDFLKKGSIRIKDDSIIRGTISYRRHG